MVRTVAVTIFNISMFIGISRLMPGMLKEDKILGIVGLSVCSMLVIAGLVEIIGGVK